MRFLHKKKFSHNHKLCWVECSDNAAYSAVPNDDYNDAF